MILIEFYDNYRHKTQTTATASYEAALAVVSALDLYDSIIQWRLAEHFEGDIPWYKENLFKRLVINKKDWKYG